MLLLKIGDGNVLSYTHSEFDLVSDVLTLAFTSSNASLSGILESIRQLVKQKLDQSAGMKA